MSWKSILIIYFLVATIVPSLVTIEQMVKTLWDNEQQYDLDLSSFDNRIKRDHYFINAVRNYCIKQSRHWILSVKISRLSLTLWPKIQWGSFILKGQLLYQVLQLSIKGVKKHFTFISAVWPLPLSTGLENH